MSLSAMGSPAELQYPTSPYVVPEKLWFDASGTNYPVWKAHIVYLLGPHGLLGFLDGTIPPPPKTILKPTDCSTMRNPDYDTWTRTDQLIKERICSLLEHGIIAPVVQLQQLADDTSRGIWMHLHQKFHQHLNQIDNGSTTTVPLTNARREKLLEDWDAYSRLCSAVQHDNWEVAENIVNNAGESMKAVGLRIAVVDAGKRAIKFLKNLVARISVESITAKDAIGNTALSIAAAIGNSAAATILVEAHHNLLYIPNILGEFPVHIAAKHARRKVLVYLIDVTNPKIPCTGLSRSTLLMSIIQADYYDIALDLVKKHPYLAKVKDSTNSALKSIAQRKHVFLSNNKHTKNCLDLVKFICMEMKSLNLLEAESIYCDAIMTAAKLGNCKMVELIVETFPNAIYCSDPVSFHNIAQVAVENRSMDVFILLRNMSNRMHLNLDLPDVNGNNLLHLAAKLTPSEKLRAFSNAVARMRHEVWWFEEVRNVVNPLCGEQLNNDGKSPMAIFREEHSKLRKEGEELMKSTASSFIIVAVLISAVAFAAAITVPGGNNSVTGLPLFAESDRSHFKKYALFNSAAFLLSVISLQAFLYISIVSYAEEDLKVYKPWILKCGLNSLYLSVHCLGLTFYWAIYLVLGAQISAALHILVHVAVIGIAVAMLSIISRVSQGFSVSISIKQNKNKERKMKLRPAFNS